MTGPDDFDDPPPAAPAVPAPMKIRNGADLARKERFARRNSLAQRMREPALGKKALKFIDLMIFEGKHWKEAALEAGIRLRDGQNLLGTPAFNRQLVLRSQHLRDTEAARNPNALARIRDHGLSDQASAADRRVAVDAARLLEQKESSGGGANVNIHITPGYVIDLSGPAEGPRQIQTPPPRFIEHDDGDLP